MQTVPRTDNIASSVIRDVLVDTLDQMDFNRYHAAKLLINADLYFDGGVFLRRNVPYDQVLARAEGGSTWKPEDVVVDAVFSRIFKLPMPNWPIVFYDSVIIESCKMAPASIAPSLGRAIRYLFNGNEVEMMDLELAQRFWEWFAHHLSNFEFRWKWAEWQAALRLGTMC